MGMTSAQGFCYQRWIRNVVKQIPLPALTLALGDNGLTLGFCDFKVILIEKICVRVIFLPGKGLLVC